MANYFLPNTNSPTVNKDNNIVWHLHNKICWNIFQLSFSIGTIYLIKLKRSFQTAFCSNAFNQSLPLYRMTACISPPCYNNIQRQGVKNKLKEIYFSTDKTLFQRMRKSCLRVLSASLSSGVK